MVNQLCGFGVNNANQAPPAFSLDFVDSALSAATGATQSVTLDFGDEPPSGEHRYIVVGIGFFTVVSIDAVTIGGVEATIIADGNDGQTHGTLAIAEVPTGTSGTVEVEASDAGERAAFASYRLMNPASATPSDTATDTGGGGNDGVATLTLDIPAGGAAVGCACSLNDLAGANVWVGLVEDVNVPITGAGGNDACSFASLTSEAGATPLTVSYTSNANDIGGASASWGPITS
jgi:hypothetical protein